MNLLVEIISTSFDILSRRVVKVFGLGVTDVRTAYEVSPFGVDGNAPQGTRGVWMKTASDGSPVLIGYVNKNQKAQPGDLRHFSLNELGEEAFYTWLKSDGTIEIGGADNHMTQFEALKAGFDQLREDHNALVDAFNVHMHATAGSGAPSPPTPIGGSIPAPDSTATIDDAKLETIKTI